MMKKSHNIMFLITRQTVDRKYFMYSGGVLLWKKDGDDI